VNRIVVDSGGGSYNGHRRRQWRSAHCDWSLASGVFEPSTTFGTTASLAGGSGGGSGRVAGPVPCDVAKLELWGFECVEQLQRNTLGQATGSFFT
jgi:hypothetical protein